MRLVTVVLSIICAWANFTYASKPDVNCSQESLKRAKLKLEAVEADVAVDALERSLSFAQLDEMQRSSLQALLKKELVRKKQIKTHLNTESVCL